MAAAGEVDHHQAALAFQAQHAGGGGDGGHVGGAGGLLGVAAGTIADPQVRNRGTIGGSLVHGDPASDLPAVMLIAEGSVTVNFGYGRENSGRVGNKIGYNAYTIQTTATPWVAAGLRRRTRPDRRS